MLQQIMRIKEKLQNIPATDPTFSVFGSKFHRYKTRSPLTDVQVTQLEEAIGCPLPESYREFILHVSNGGAGPYYGLLDMETVLKENSVDRIKLPCRVLPQVSANEWKSLIDNSEQELDSNGNAIATHLGGLLYIGKQSTTQYTALVVSGEYTGRIVYVSTDEKPPHFSFENSILDWYERWLDELYLGYNTNQYGKLMGGNDELLIKAFTQTTLASRKKLCIESLVKLPFISESSQDFLADCIEEETTEISLTALNVLTKFNYEYCKEYLEESIRSGEEYKVLAAFESIYWHAKEHSNDWIYTIADIILTLKERETLDYALFILDETEEEYGRLVEPLVLAADENIRVACIDYLGRLQTRAEYLETLKQCLQDKNQKVIHAALQAISGVATADLISPLNALVDQLDHDHCYLKSNMGYILDEIYQSHVSTHHEIDSIREKMEQKWA